MANNSKLVNSKLLRIFIPLLIIAALLVYYIQTHMTHMMAPRHLPAVPKWDFVASHGIIQKKKDDVYLVEGDKTLYGYQLISPPIKVPANSVVDLHLDINPVKGSFGVGILDAAKLSWLAPAERGATDITFNTKSNKQVYVVIANDNQGIEKPAISEFEIGAGLMQGHHDDDEDNNA